MVASFEDFEYMDTWKEGGYITVLFLHPAIIEISSGVCQDWFQHYLLTCCFSVMASFECFECMAKWKVFI